MHLIATAIEVAGVGIIVISALVAAGLFLPRALGPAPGRSLRGISGQSRPRHPAWARATRRS
jgi:hypothetical protein